MSAADFCDNRHSPQYVPGSESVNNPTAASEAVITLRKALVLNEQCKGVVCKFLEWWVLEADYKM